MKKNIFKQSYFLGMSMGICISILIVIIFFSFDKTSSKERAKLINENADLKSQLIEKDTKKEELNISINDLKMKNTEKKEKSETDKTDAEKIVLDIRQDMSNSQIADLLVENEIYTHKNDILLIMEILNFDRYRYSEVLEKYGYISGSYELNQALKQIENSQYGVTDALYSSGLVKDKNSFMKLLYLFDINNRIKYGQKQFNKNSSLREVCDILIS